MTTTIATPFEAMTKVWKLLNAQVAGNLTGGVYKMNRPLGSTLEDIVVNSLPTVAGTGDLDECIINVNCYAPSVPSTKNGVTFKVANTKRMQEIAELVAGKLRNVDDTGGHYAVNGIAVLHELSTDDYYTNIRVYFKFTNV